MTKIISIFIFTFLIIGLLFFVFQEKVQDDKNTLLFWQFWDESWLEPAIVEFEKQNLGITVRVERLTWSDGFNKIITAMVANAAPDVIEIGSTWVAGLSRDGGLQSIDPGELKDILDHWEPAKLQDIYYAIPWTLSTQAFFYNKKLLQQAGIEKVPTDWNELYLASKKIHDLGEEFYGYGLKTGSYTTWQKFLPFAWSNNARLLYPDLKSTGVASNQFIEAVEFYKQLKSVSLFDENHAVRKAFQEGKLGFMLEEPGQVKKFQQESPDLEFGVALLPVSPKTKKSINFAGGQMLAVTKNSQKKIVAEKFVKFMAKPENATLITSKITTLFPANKEAIQDDFYQKENPELLIFLQTLQSAVSPPAHPEWVQIQEVFSNALEEVLYDKKPPQEAMEATKTEILKILSQD